MIVTSRVGVPDHEVGVAADRDRALAWIESVELRGVGRRQRDESVDVDALAQHALGEQERQPRLESRDAVRHLMEGRDRAPRRACRAGPRSETARGRTRRPGTRRSRGRSRSPPGSPCRAAADCRCTWRLRSPERRDRRGSGTGTAGRSRRKTLRPRALRPANLLDRLAPRHVHDQHRQVDELGERDGAMRRLALDQHRAREPRGTWARCGPRRASCSVSHAMQSVFSA